VIQSLEAEYRAVTQDVGIADASDRTFVELTGADRAKFLHNLCSNDSGCEAFLLNVKGKVAGHVFVYCSEDSLILDSSPGQGERIIVHLDRYIIREKVELHDERDLFAQLLLAGPRAAEVLERSGCRTPQEILGHQPGEIARAPVFVRHSGLTGPDSFTLVCLAAQKDELVKALTDAGAVWCSPAAVEAARIEAGMPLYGVDITEDNLPQEVNRNDRAISFTKGCYLGQETVARIDALGHVNRTLVGLKFAPPHQSSSRGELKFGNAVVGQATSIAYSPRTGSDVGLGYVRASHNALGTPLTFSGRAVEVVSLPMR
jgi:folate-binding protein YgfZ